MTKITANVLESFLREYGWSFRSLGDNQWITGWQGKEKSFLLRIIASNSFVSLNVGSIFSFKVDWEYWPELAAYLLTLNNDSKMVKLGIDENDEISLSMDILVKNLKYENFSHSLGILGYYADYFYDKILNQLHALGFQYSQPQKFLT